MHLSEEATVDTVVEAVDADVITAAIVVLRVEKAIAVVTIAAPLVETIVAASWIVHVNVLE